MQTTWHIISPLDRPCVVFHGAWSPDAAAASFWIIFIISDLKKEQTSWPLWLYLFMFTVQYVKLYVNVNVKSISCLGIKQIKL